MTDTRSLIQQVVDEYASSDPAGQSEASLPWLLHALVVATRPAVVVEIGSFKGLSAMSIAAGLKWNADHPPSAALREWNAREHPAPGLPGDGVLYCIDPVRHDEFDRMLRRFGHEDRVRFLESPSNGVDASKLPPIDMLFIDGDHSYRACREDFERFYPRVRPGGLVLIHDIFPDATQHHVESEPWWGPNLFVRQLREAYGFADGLVIDTHFPSLAIFRKSVEHIDYPFLSTKGLTIAVLQFAWRRARSVRAWLPVSVAKKLSGGRVGNRRWRAIRYIARLLRLNRSSP